MEFERDRRPLDLEHWLSIATRKLSSESRERIRKEIEEHYFEAMDAARSQGHQDADAQREAIETLGDPRSAARSFRRHHLTKFQAGLVKDVGRKPPKYRFYLYSPVLILAFVINVTHISSVWDLVIFVGMLTIMCGAFVAHFWWAAWLYRHGQARASLSVDMLSTWLFFAAMQFGSSLLLHSSIAGDALIYGVALLIVFGLLTPLLRKMSDHPRKVA